MQGELFTADVFVFPSSRRASLVRETAEKLAALEMDQPAEADRLWKEICGTLIDSQIRAGMTEAEAMQDHRAFTAAVHVEIQHVALRMMQA